MTALRRLFQELSTSEQIYQKWIREKAQALEENRLKDARRAEDAVMSWETEVIGPKRGIDRLLETEYSQYPPQHARHFPTLPKFHRAATFEKSVVLMTKFPDEHDSTVGKELNAELETIIACVSQAVTDAGFVPRVARGKSRYCALLWDNVEVHLLGSKFGIAIVEDTYKPELNPNVALEWGWMRAMGRQVLYLREAKFKHERADLSGLLISTFEWHKPYETIPKAVAEFLRSQEDHESPGIESLRSNIA